ncbi:MBL fold metallo-hydrolase [Pelobium manganitolerans]|uniref:MBL fold metallo-hydrolase n=1 Tax=Pelobium manganitolerans TaxID=1842495 RepID=UPI003FA34E1A
MRVTALFEGSFSVDASKKFIPFNPSVDKASDRPASLFVFIQPFLIKTAEDLILIDTGLGFSDPSGELILHKNIRNAGYKAEDVSKVLMSHLHFDHSGGMVMHNGGSLGLSFPNADYFIQRGEWESAYSSNSSSYKTEIFDVVQRSGQIVFLEGDGEIDEHISYEVTGGHTPYHQAFHIESEGKHVFFGGDVVPEPEQLQRKFMAKYDYDGRKAMEERLVYGQKAADENWICLFYHAKTKAIGTVEIIDEAVKIKDLGHNV